MLRGYRRPLLVAFGWLVLTATNQGAENANSAEPAAKANPAPTAPQPRAPYAPYPDRYSEACYNTQDHDSADLCAQWRAAVAAEKAASEARRATSWAIIATFLSLIGVGGLLYTLWQTNGALGEARRGNIIATRANARATRRAVIAAQETEAALSIARQNADAATRQAEIAEDMARRQLRAYLGVSKIRANGPVVGEPIEARIFLRNRGRTPATIQDTRIACMSSNELIPPEELFGDELPIGAFDMHINPDEQQRLVLRSNEVLDQAEVDAIKAGTLFLVFWGYVEYADCFGLSHVTRWRVRYEYRQGRYRFSFLPGGNEAT